MRGLPSVIRELERDFRARCDGQGGGPGPHPGHQRGLAESRYPGEGKQAGHGDARQHTGGDDGAKRYRQMGGGNREGRHSEA
jgi:hypothetical protein